MRNNNHKKLAAGIAGVVFVGCTMAMVHLWADGRHAIVKETTMPTQAVSSLETKPMPSNKDNLEPLEKDVRQFIEPKNPLYSIYVKNLDSGSALAVHNEKIRAASMIKLFIMAEAFRQAKEGRLNLAELRILTDADKVGGAGSLQSMPEGTRRTWRQLIEKMIDESDNTATNMVIERVGMAKVNQFIVNNGFRDTILQRKMMDLESIEAGRENYTTVSDLGILLEKIYRKQCVGTAEDEEMLDILLQQEDNDKIPSRLPNTAQVAHKTGELVGALHDGGVVLGGHHPYVVCIMSEHVGSTRETTKDIAVLSEKVYQFLDRI